MLMVCFHVVVQLCFTSAVGEVSSDYFIFPAKAQYKGQLLILKKLFLNVTFL